VVTEMEETVELAEVRFIERARRSMLRVFTGAAYLTAIDNDDYMLIVTGDNEHSQRVWEFRVPLQNVTSLVTSSHPAGSVVIGAVVSDIELQGKEESEPIVASVVTSPGPTRRAGIPWS
jgi:hypothetical protein